GQPRAADRHRRPDARHVALTPVRSFSSGLEQSRRPCVEAAFVIGKRPSPTASARSCTLEPSFLRRVNSRESQFTQETM
ncbi:hypothetical protein, partial [Bradyrhizobium brasilense]|uniref:hypothetical protein n=1 Tax=Bradyrhizobium brasilense TaxID=1419277 RepID=UPI001E4DD670